MHPVVATVLGLVGGLIATALSVYLPQIPPATDVNKRLIYGYAGVLASMVYSILAIAVYWWFFRSSFVWFGVTFCFAYIIGVGAYFVQNIKVIKGNSDKQ